MRGTRLIQICFVVENLEESMTIFEDAFGAGPWVVAGPPPLELDSTVYRGDPTPMGCDFALAFGNGTLFELVSPRPGSRSVFTEIVDQRGYGMHHFGFAVDDFDGLLEQLDRTETPVMTGVTPRGSRVLMRERQQSFGVLEEYIEMIPATRVFYDQLRSDNERKLADARI